LLQDGRSRYVFMFNHLEYDTHTLDDEYRRDLGRRAGVALPENYYPNDNPGRTPRNGWRACAHLLFANWINEIYQTTPYDVAGVGLAA